EAPGGVPAGVHGGFVAGLSPRLRRRRVTRPGDPDDEPRRQFDAWIAGLPDRLETDPELRERGERIKRDVLGSTLLRDWSSSLWHQAKDTLRAQAADPDSEMRRRLAAALVAAGWRPASDRRPPEGLGRMAEAGRR